MSANHRAGNRMVHRALKRRVGHRPRHAGAGTQCRGVDLGSTRPRALTPGPRVPQVLEHELGKPTGHHGITNMNRSGCAGVGEVGLAAPHGFEDPGRVRFGRCHRAKNPEQEPQQGRQLMLVVHRSRLGEVCPPKTPRCTTLALSRSSQRSIVTMAAHSGRDARATQRANASSGPVRQSTRSIPPSRRVRSALSRVNLRLISVRIVSSRASST